MSKVQQYIVRSVTQSLSEKVDAEIKIGKIDYKPFNTVKLYDVYVEDQKKDTLLFVKELNAYFKLFQALRGKIIFHSLELNEFSGNIVVDKEGKRNFDFLIEAFSKKDKKTNDNVDFSIEQLNIQKSAFRIRSYAPKRQKNKKMYFNPNDIFFSDINTDIKVNTLKKDSLSMRILYLSAKERSGLNLNRLRTDQITASRSKISTSKLDIQLNKSNLKLADIELKYDSLADFKNFVEKVFLKAELKSSKVNLNDISPFVPDFKGLNITTDLAVKLFGRVSNLHAKELSLSQEDNLSLKTDIDLDGLPNIDQTFLFANIRELKFDTQKSNTFITKTFKKPVRVFDELTRLGKIFYSGNITGLFSNLVLFGELKTELGEISTDILLKSKNQFSQLEYNGTIGSKQLKIGKLLGKTNLGDFSFYLNTSGKKQENSPFQGTVIAKVSSASLNDYTYSDLEFNGRYDGNGFDGQLNIDDKNIKAEFNGLIDLSKSEPKFNFELVVDSVNLHALNLTSRYPQGLLAFRGKTELTGRTLDDMNGQIRFDSIRIKNKKEELEIDRLLLQTETKENYTRFSVQSKYINGDFHGNFKYSNLASISTFFLKKYLPALEPKKKTEPSIRIDLNLKLDNTADLFEILEFPCIISGESSITGFLDDNTDSIDIVSRIPELSYKNRTFKHTQLHLVGGAKEFDLLLESNVLTKDDFWNFTLSGRAANDKISSKLEWRNKDSEWVNKGVLSSITNFFQDKDEKLQISTNIIPTELTLDNLIWKIQESAIDFSPEGAIHFNNVRMGNEERFLRVNGIGSKNMSDSISLELSKIDLSVISVFASMGNFDLKGKTSGRATIYSLLHRPILASDLSVKDLMFNNKIIGDAGIISEWNQDKQKLYATVGIKTDKYPVAKANCTYSPKENQLDVSVDATKFNMSFLTSYFETIIPDLKGYASGKIHIGGPLTDIRFDGRMKISQGEITVGIIGTKYHFNDSVIIKPTRIEIPNATLYDKNKNKAKLRGYANHSGDFKDFDFDVTMTAKNAEVMNLKPGDNDFFSGEAYADATVRLYGDESLINFKINGITKPGTKVLFQFAQTGKLTDDEFIQFVVHEEKNEFDFSKDKARKRSNIKVDLQIEATTDAEVEFLIDPSGGDMISGTGHGNMHLKYDNTQSDIGMWGHYTIENGHYLFTLQDVFRKGFKIDRGSTIQWAGDPLKAKVAIQAIYPLTASLKDLMDETLLQSTNRTLIPVNCILNLSGNLMSPAVKFDIQLPSSDEGIKQIVRNIINTDEMMMRQFIYLLVFSRFYTPAYMRAEDSINTGSQEFFSLASTTLSSHLNHIMSKFSKMFTLGVDVRRMDEENMEYHTAILFQPNERWIVNGNFGVRDNKKMLENYNRFVTDIDIEYLLTKSGKLRLKAYNHTIDRAQLRTAKNTQGVGFMYKEDFKNVKGLFSHYWTILKRLVTTETKDETKD